MWPIICAVLFFKGLIMRKLSLCALALGVSLTLPASAMFNLNTSVSYNGKTDIDDSNSEISSTVYNLRAISDHFSFAIKHTTYDFSGSDFREEPFDSLTFLALDARDEGELTGPWGYFVGLTYGMGFEEDINLGDNYSIIPRAGVSFKFNQDVQGFLGAVANFNEADNKFLPILGIKIGSENNLGWSGSLAYPATRLTYRFNETIALESVLLTVKETYQLADDSKIYKEGYLMEESYGAALGAIFTPFSHLVLRAGVQGYFDREYTLYSSSGHEIDSFETDPCVGAYVSLGYTF